MSQRLGQHFLKNKSVIKKIIDAIDPRDNDVIIEVGPGHGELTEHLEKQNVKCKIIAIERDARLAASLEKKFLPFHRSTDSSLLRHPESAAGGEGFLHGLDSSSASGRIQNDRTEIWLARNDERGNKCPEIKVIHGDVLKVLPEVTYPPLTIHYKLVGNIPYYLTGHLFRVISELPILPERTVFMIQKEVAERITALPPRMNLLAASIRYWSEPNIITIVSKNDFSPPPKVESAVLSLTTLPSAGREGDAARKRYYRTIKLLFTQPRKTILNNLKSGIASPREAILSELERTGIALHERPQNLSVGDIKKISEIVYNIIE